MIVATYSVHQENPRILTAVPSPALWLVKIFATDGESNLTREIKNRQRCMLTDLLPTAAEQIEELISELPSYTDAGFQVIRLR